ncbi:ABC transporter substrate-binding protein, partial [Fibrobacterota bacterium]
MKFGITATIITILFVFEAGALNRSNKRSRAKAQAAKLFTQGKEHFKDSNYRQAGKSLSQLMKNYPRSHHVEEALVLLADLSVRQNQTDLAEKHISKFLLRFPGSKYTPRMVYYQGLIYLGRNQNYDAARMFMQATNNTGSRKFFNTVKQSLLKLVSQTGLKEKELQNIIEKLKFDRELISSLLLSLGNLQVKNNRHKAATITYEMWLHYFYSDRNAGSVREKLRTSKKKESSYQTIVIMIPLTGIDKDIGRSLLEGMLLVLDGLIERSQGSLQYLIVDTKGDPISALNRLRRTIQEENVLCILGPAMSDVSTAVAIELSSSNSRIPMITPTATTQGISALGAGIFQINVTTSALGKTISNYAVNCLKLQEFAILATNTEYGMDLARAFEKGVTDQGGRIIATEYYDSEAKDYAGHFKVIRRRKAQSFLENKWMILGKDPKRIPQKELKSWSADSVLFLDGLFIAAANGDEALKLLSQARYHKLKTNILGSSGWYDNAILHKGLGNLNGIFLSVGFYQDEKSSAWLTFKKDYFSRWGVNPNRVSILGYNAALFAAQGMKTGSGKDLVKALRNIRNLKTPQGTITFDPGEGFNKSADLVKIGRRKFEKVE